MNNAPQVKIQYLVNYDLEVSGQDGVSGLDTSDLNPLSDLSNINNQDAQLRGKKGLHLSGGSVDEVTGEVSGVLLDGTYTFFSDSEKSYKGIMGNSLSRDDYLFINPDDYENKSGEELEQILNLSDKNEEEYNYYCTSDSINFKQGNVYNIKWQTFYDNEYVIANVDETTEGVYYIETSSIDAFGNTIYDEVKLPREYDSLKTYYSFSVVDNSHYVFTLKEQTPYITIRTKNENTYIRSLLIYFDPVATEYATEISFSNAKKYDPTTDSEIDDPTYTTAKTYKNERLVFLHNFGENSTLTQIQININKWSKKNSLMKILKIVTGYTGIYDRSSLMKFDFNINKTNDAQQLRFGVSSNNCTIDVLDKDLMIDTLYQKDLIYKNVQVQVLVDGIMQGIFYINEKSSEKGSNEWVFDCVDRLELLKEIKRPMMSIKERNVYEMVNYVLSGVVSNVVWEKGAKEYCESVFVEKSYFKANQTLYDLMLKCCQVGLLRIYVDREDKVKITSGVN